MSFDELIADMDDSLMASFGEVAIYNRRYKVSVVIDKDVAQLGEFDTHGPVRRHEASFLVAEVPAPKRGQSLETNQGNFVLDGVITNDGHIVRVHINAR